MYIYFIFMFIQICISKSLLNRYKIEKYLNCIDVQSIYVHIIILYTEILTNFIHSFIDTHTYLYT